MTAERLLNVRCQGSDQLAIGAKQCMGKRRKKERRKEIKERETARE